MNFSWIHYFDCQASPSYQYRINLNEITGWLCILVFWLDCMNNFGFTWFCNRSRELTKATPEDFSCCRKVWLPVGTKKIVINSIPVDQVAGGSPIDLRSCRYIIFLLRSCMWNAGLSDRHFGFDNEGAWTSLDYRYDTTHHTRVISRKLMRDAEIYYIFEWHQFKTLG